MWFTGTIILFTNSVSLLPLQIINSSFSVPYCMLQTMFNFTLHICTHCIMLNWVFSLLVTCMSCLKTGFWSLECPVSFHEWAIYLYLLSWRVKCWSNGELWHLVRPGLCLLHSTCRYEVKQTCRSLFRENQRVKNQILTTANIFDIILAVHHDILYNKTNQMHFLEFYSDIILYMFRMG